MTSDKSRAGWYFLIGVALLYLVSLFFSPEKFVLSLNFFKGMLIKIIPVLVLIFVLMALTNYFVKPKKLVKYLGRNSGLKGWLIAIVAGILSSGPIYMWYPLLSDLQKHGMRVGLISAFLYNRAIKIPLLPLLIVYFGVTYSVVLMIVMILVSIIQSLATEKLMRLFERK